MMTEHPEHPEPTPQPQQPESGLTPEHTEHTHSEISLTKAPPTTTRTEQSMQKFLDECGKLIVGQKEMLELMLICILSDGHILLEGVPGVAKTLSAKTMAKAINTEFSRIQFTPDLMPTDIIGTSIFNMKESEFVFKKGPVFSNIVLIDEINRAPAKTQSALFEVMEEQQISYDGVQYEMGDPFLVVATQNPVEQEGTYRLPEAQLDRFLMKINLKYPNATEELHILNKFLHSSGKVDISIVNPILSSEDLNAMRAEIAQVLIKEEILQYIVGLVRETREHSKIYLGASPRATLALMKTSKVAALISGRNFVIPEDVQYVAPHILNHRLLLSPDAEMEGLDAFDVIKEIISSREVPR